MNHIPGDKHSNVGSASSTSRCKVLQERGDKPAIEGFLMSASVEALHTSASVEKNVVNLFVIKREVIVMKKQDVLITKRDTILIQATMKSGLEGRASQKMFKVILLMTATKRTALLIQPKTTIGTPLVENSLKVVHN